MGAAGQQHKQQGGVKQGQSINERSGQPDSLYLRWSIDLASGASQVINVSDARS
jgi:hypothetical protein